MTYSTILEGNFQGDYTEGDRDVGNREWQAANAWNLMQEDGHLAYDSIRDRLEFYNWFQGLSDDLGHETRWPGAAYEVAKGVDLLASVTESLIGSIGIGEFSVPFDLGPTFTDEVNRFSNEGNQVIFDDAFPKLRNLVTGSGKPVTDYIAYLWDAHTLSQEQNLTQPMYGELSNAAMWFVRQSTEQDIFGAQRLSELLGIKLPPFDKEINKPSHRWEYGMDNMGYDVDFNEMPRPPLPYINGEALNDVRR